MASSTDARKNIRKNAEYKKKAQLREARLEHVARLYRRGYSMRGIRREVMRILGLETYSLQTVKRDVDILLSEWRGNRLKDIDAAVTLELARIDDHCRELWEQWDKSKTDCNKVQRRQKGAPARDDGTGQASIRTVQTERTETEVVMLGDPAYITEIRKQEEERRKLLGLYAPEKKEVTGDSFYAFLIESGLLDDEGEKTDEQQEG